MAGSLAEMVGRLAKAVGGSAVGRLVETGGLVGAVGKSVVVGSSVARSLVGVVGGLGEAVGSLVEAVGSLVVAVAKSAVGSLVVGSLAEAAERSAEAVRNLVVGILVVGFQHMESHPYESQSQ
jgi:hypothetical protein